VKAGDPDYYNNCGYFMVFGFMDQLFNNTIYLSTMLSTAVRATAPISWAT